MSKSARLSCLLAFLFLSLLTSEAQQQPSVQKSKLTVITLTNGDVISGHLIAESDDSITIRDGILGDIQVPRAKTVRISNSVDQNQTTEVQLQQVTVAASSPQKQTVSPQSAAATASGIPVAKLKLSSGLLLSSQKQQSYSGELDLVKNWNPQQTGWPHQRSLLLLSPSYDDKSSSKGANITRNYNGIFQHVLFTSSDSLFVPILLNFYSNNSLGIYLQQTYGAGVGKDLGPLELSADLRFIGEHFLTPPKTKNPVPSLGLVGSGLSERFDLPLTAFLPGAKLTETLEFVPVFNQSSAWQGHGIAELSLPFTKQLSFVLSAFDNYVENAPPGFRKNYFKSTIGIQYSPASPKK